MKVLVREGQQKLITTGFSFTVLFFGVFVPIFRGDGIGFLIQFLLGIFTCGISWFVVPFTYNKSYEKRLKNQGWSLLK
jgi:hypothetical protein